MVTRRFLYVLVVTLLAGACGGGEETGALGNETPSPTSLILEKIEKGEDYELVLFSDDKSNYDAALNWCTEKHPESDCQAALEEVVGEPVDLDALYAEAKEVPSHSSYGESNDSGSSRHSYGSSGGGSGGSAKFTASVGDFGAADGDTVVAEVAIRNRGGAAGSASCIATIDNTTGNSGHDIFSTPRIKPGSVFRTRVDLATEDGTAHQTTGIRLTCS